MNAIMQKKWMMAMVPGILAVMAVVFIIVLLLVKLLWAWTIPDLFPGAVDQNLIAREISWFTSFKLAVFIGALAGIAGLRRGDS